MLRRSVWRLIVPSSTQDFRRMSCASGGGSLARAGFSNCGDAEALYTLTIADIAGKQVFEKAVACGQQNLNLSNLDNGTYLLSVVSADGNERWNYKLLLLK